MWKRICKKILGSPFKIFHSRVFTYIIVWIVLLCDGKCHCKYGECCKKPLCGNQMNLASLNIVLFFYIRPRIHPIVVLRPTVNVTIDVRAALHLSIGNKVKLFLLVVVVPKYINTIFKSIIHTQWGYLHSVNSPSGL